MENFEQIGKELARQGKTEDIKRLAESEDGKSIGRMIDAQKLQEAARRGDGKAMHEMLSAVLGTDEGKRLAESIRRIMEP